MLRKCQTLFFNCVKGGVKLGVGGVNPELDYLAGMFTGIIECTGRIDSISPKGTNLSFWIQSPLSAELKVDQSVSHNGVCLTVEAVKEGSHLVTAIEETIKNQPLRLGRW